MIRPWVRVAVALAVLSGTVVAGSIAASASQQDLSAVRRATAPFHDVEVAERAGYAPLLDCFDSDEGGMGQHYAQGIDDEIDALRPEALVYEVGPSGLRLVAVEWIVPDSAAVRANVPSLFGQHFHLEESLGVWVLHAWVWRANPSGMFADWNPHVDACPESV